MTSPDPPLPTLVSDGTQDLSDTGGAQAQTPQVLQLRVPHQDQNNWCWAAVTVGIENAYENRQRSQCQVATEVFATVGQVCCPVGTNIVCDQRQRLSLALIRYHGTPVLDRAQRTPDFITGEIDSGRPVPVRMVSRESEGHFVVISGYRLDGPEMHLIVCDPRAGFRVDYTFDQFKTNYEQNWSWDYSYTTQGPRQIPKEP